MDRFYDFLITASVADGASRLFDGRGNCGVAHDPTAPYVIYDVVFGDDPIGVLS